jgi:Mg-chelatase subunit ChlD
MNFQEFKIKEKSKPNHFIFAMDDSGSMGATDGKPINRWE